jgi:AcrR family transcriptional regulator
MLAPADDGGPAATDAATAVARGRPRSARADRSILDAALELLAERGYAGMSVEAVATRARVSKPTIYLRYPSKAELAGAALASAAERGAPERSGDSRADLIATLRHFRQSLEGSFGSAMFANVLAAEPEAPELVERFRERLVLPAGRALREVLDAARANGEIQEGADVDAGIHMLTGSYWGHFLTGEPLSLAWPATHVDIVLAGLAAAPRGGPRLGRRARSGRR